ncbi:MAG: sporulation peptidase YabG [Lachnospirales bacterium]
MEVGDIVYATYNGENLRFSINCIDNEICKLHCLDYRLTLKLPKDELTTSTLEETEDFARTFKKNSTEIINKILSERIKDFDNKIEKTKVLHIDGDANYLNLCMKTYENLDIDAYGEFIPLEQQKNHIQDLLKKYKPTVLVITGHDFFENDKNKYSLDSYEGSKHYVETVAKARELMHSRSELIIICGACQSYYEEIIKAGANFASSPKRVLVHALDPVLIAERVIYTNIQSVLDGREAVKNTISGSDGYGGIDTQGTLRGVYPHKYS